jgi:hypothetical protein
MHTCPAPQKYVAIVFKSIRMTELFSCGAEHGLRTPNKAFFQRISKLLGLGRQFGQIDFGVFSADMSAPILVH